MEVWIPIHSDRLQGNTFVWTVAQRTCQEDTLADSHDALCPHTSCLVHKHTRRLLYQLYSWGHRFTKQQARCVLACKTSQAGLTEYAISFVKEEGLRVIEKRGAMALMKGVCSSLCLGLSPCVVVDVNKCMRLDQTRSMSTMNAAHGLPRKEGHCSSMTVAGIHYQLTHSLAHSFIPLMLSWITDCRTASF